MSTVLLFLIIIVTTVPPTLNYYTGNNPQRSIYNKLTQEADFEGFSGLIRNNKDARMDLLQNELTVFVPTNHDFQNYKKPLHSDLAFYHMANRFYTLEDLGTIKNISSIKENFPKLWITKTNNGIFVNNAEIITFMSNYPGKTKEGKNAKQQMLHIIDDVLDPILRNPKFPHAAYDFMTSTYKWSLDTEKTVTSFLQKVNEYRLSHLYQMDGSNTYFIPVDSSLDPHKFKMLNKYTIFGHMVPNHVLFTRPTVKGHYYNTMANDNDVEIKVCLEESGNKMYVRGVTELGNENNPKGTFVAEIIEPNIPVYNGVVHLISQPLGIFNRTLKPFPYLPILDKLATDPTLDTFYEMGNRTGFNQIFSTRVPSFTYFVPNDYAWRQIKKQGLSFRGSEVDLLKRHLIISDTPYSMERLLAMTNSKKFSDLEIRTVGGILRLKVLLIDDHYYIRWHNTYIKVLRPNYECPDGLIHILAGPIANLH